MSLGEIIKSYRKTNSMSMDDFSRASGISKAYISMLEKNLNPQTGRAPIPTIEYIQKAAKGMFMSFNELFGLLDNNTVADSSYLITKKAIRIPVLKNVTAGIPIEAIADIIDYEEISEELAHTGEFFALKIKDASMEPMISNGDVVIVKKTDDANTGDIVIALVNGDDATCKRLVKYASGIRLMPINPAYEPIFFSNEEVLDKPVRIIGKIMESRKKFY